MTLDQIKSEIEHLTLRERLELRAWIGQTQNDDWDDQMDRDSDTGRLDHLAQEVQQAKRANKLRELP